MYELSIARLVLSILLIVLNVLDVYSTNIFLANDLFGIHEANPVMAWFQKRLGKWWWLTKVFALMLIAVAWYLPLKIGVMALFMLCGFYAIVVKNNFDLIKEK